MHVWVIKDGEVLPLDPSSSRMRTGMLATELCRRGHTVTWWASTFSHQTKERLFDRDTVVRIDSRLQLRLLHGGIYRRNVSLRRAIHHRIVGRRFARAARSVPRPDVVVAALPTIDLAYHAARYCEASKVPLVVDVRDPWPESLVDKCPPLLQSVARRLLAYEYRRAAAALRGATAIAAITPGCLQWGLDLAGRQRSSADAVFALGAEPIRPVGAPTAAVRDVLTRIRDKVVFIYVGTFGHSYQLGLVADVAEDLDRRGVEEAHFVLAGDGQQLAGLRRRAARLRNLTVTGWLNRTDRGHLLAAASVGLAPLLSVPQALGNKVCEYLAAGLPLLTSLRGETGDLIRSHGVGYLYRAGDVTSLRAAVEAMLSAPTERARMAARSRELFEHRFQACHIYSAYADLVERLGAQVTAVAAAAAS
ncbi:MAG: glycosyltransferase [Acidobacteria bacterium]|nr:glycosyltransferase [Acidobacteriota bacterium]